MERHRPNGGLLMAGLAVNVDHVATLREARKGSYPDPVAAAVLAELAGAAPLAGALQVKEQVRDKTIALVLSGGNISPEKLKHCLD